MLLERSLWVLAVALMATSPVCRPAPGAAAAPSTAPIEWTTSPVDLSFLNAAERPAGRRGFLKVVGAHLEFEDGTIARFWGTNLTAQALFGTSRDAVRQQARRLSQLGFNLVRLHHHDSPWVSPNIFGEREARDTQQLSGAMLEKLDWWIKCLKDEGIYVWLDLHVLRGIKPGDGVEDFEEIARGRSSADLRGFNYVNPSIALAMQRFNAAYVTHRNIHTGLRYADDPAIVAMLLTNENDVTSHFGNALLPAKNVAGHTARYLAAAEEFARKHRLPQDQVWRAWEHGPAKLFLNDLEHRFAANMLLALRKLGVRAPVATTSSWGNNPLSSLPALTTGDLIDVHAYGGTGELEKNPLLEPSMVHWMAAAHVAGRPLSVTEWNVHPFPIPDRHAIPMFVAATASLQSWDMLMQYAYSQVPLDGPGGPSNWHAFNDPALLATLPAAGLLYRRRDVREAETVYAFTPTPSQLFDKMISPRNSVALRTAAERGRLVVVLPRVKELPWLEQPAPPVGARVLTDPDEPFLERDAGESSSDTGEVRRNWRRGLVTINAPRTQAAMGSLAGERIILDDVEIAVRAPRATISVQSLDDNPIRNASFILISFSAGSLPTGVPGEFHAEPLSGDLIVRAPKGLKLYRAGSAHPPRQRQPVYMDGRYHVDLGASMDTHWLMLDRRKSGVPADRQPGK